MVSLGASLLVMLGAVVAEDRLVNELDHAIYASFDAVAARDGGVFSPAALVFHAEAQTRGKVLGLVLPVENNRAMRMAVSMPNGEMLAAFMDPYNADLRGTARAGGIMTLTRKVFETREFDRIAGGEIAIAADPAGYLQQFPGANDALSQSTLGSNTLPSYREIAIDSIINSDLCSATLSEPDGSSNQSITLDDAIDTFASAGLVPPYTIVLPRGAQGLYVATYFPSGGSSAHTVYVDPHDGHIVRDE